MSTENPLENLFDGGIDNFLDEYKKDQEALKRKLAEKLEGATYEEEVFSEEDMNKIIEVNKKLQELIKGSNLEKVKEYLDGLDLWQVRFSTGVRNEPRESDSLYYVMANGASLRLKRSEIEKGLGKVIQPFMETIFFEDKEFNPTDELDLGRTTREYCSKEFMYSQIQDEAKGEFKSEVKRFYKDGRLIYVEPPKNLYHDHNGSEVNDVFYISPEIQ